MKRPLLALTLLAALPALTLSAAASAADGLNYNFVEGGYVATHGDTDADGWGVNASAALSPNFHLFGSYSGQKTDPFFVNGVKIDSIDANQWRLGLGYNYGIGANTDLVARVAYDKYKIDNVTVGGVNYGGGDVNGYSAEVGVRSALAPKFEGYALAGYEDSNDFSGDFYGRLGAQVKFNQNWGLSGDVKFASGDTQWFVGPRYSW
ncbi:MAG TPA: diffusible signal factor-reguated Ax21 family protein [Luteimonas sp.]|nr:diffusible signal factor-reguated Ax21 family protein [Luteimonas sp.]